MIVYHGTTLEIQRPDIIHSKGHLDFGIGFYTTSYANQAERWAYRKAMRLSMPAIVNVYEIGDMTKYNIKQFTDTDQEWLQFVVACRNGSEIYKNYDAVIGNVANDDVFKCINMYMDGIWDESRTLKEISYFRKNDQIAFLSQSIINDIVTFKDSYEVQL